MLIVLRMFFRIVVMLTVLRMFFQIVVMFIVIRMFISCCNAYCMLYQRPKLIQVMLSTICCNVYCTKVIRFHAEIIKAKA